MCKHVTYDPNTWRKCAVCLEEREKATTIKNANKIKAEIIEEEAVAKAIEDSGSTYAAERAARYREDNVKPLQGLLKRAGIM
jgi:hypothetical protein